MKDMGWGVGGGGRGSDHSLRAGLLEDSHRGQTGGCQRGGVAWEFGVSRGKLLYIEWINKVLL